MKIPHTMVLLLLLTALSDASPTRDVGCNYECHSGPLGNSCSLQVKTAWTSEFFKSPTFVPRCKPCAVVCQERDNGFIGGYTWDLYLDKADVIDLDDQKSNKN